MRLKVLAVFAVVIAAIWGVGFLAGNSQTYKVSAYFVNADRIVAQNDVTINGQIVGKVTDVQLTPQGSQQDGGAVITMEIQSRYTPLHQGTRAEIRPKGLLGSMPGHDRKLQDELIYANASLGELNGALKGHQQDLNLALKEFPGLLAMLKPFEQQSAATLTTIYPCMGDVILTLAEMQNSTAYSHSAGSNDGTGDMLRVYPVLTGGNEAQSGSSFTPAAAKCHGSPP